MTRFVAGSRYSSKVAFTGDSPSKSPLFFVHMKKLYEHSPATRHPFKVSFPFYDGDLDKALSGSFGDLSWEFVGFTDEGHPQFNRKCDPYSKEVSELDQALDLWVDTGNDSVLITPKGYGSGVVRGFHSRRTFAGWDGDARSKYDARTVEEQVAEQKKKFDRMTRRHRVLYGIAAEPVRSKGRPRPEEKQREPSPNSPSASRKAPPTLEEWRAQIASSTATTEASEDWLTNAATKFWNWLHTKPR